jgi:hypothetical protein
MKHDNHQFGFALLVQQYQQRTNFRKSKRVHLCKVAIEAPNNENSRLLYTTPYEF